MFVVIARNSLKSLAASSDSDLSEVEPFITQTKAALMAVLQLSFRKAILNLPLRVQTTSKQLTISIFAPRIFRTTCMLCTYRCKAGGGGGGSRAWGGTLIVFVGPGVGHLTDLVLPGEGIFESFFARRGDI